MGNKNNSKSPSVEQYNNTKRLTLEKFKEEAKRNMTIHILSNNSKDCIDFIDLFTKEKEKIKNFELLEKDIVKKVNLYSFMNYIIYESVNALTDKLEKKVKECSDNPKNSNFSEVIVILDNADIKAQIKEIIEFKKNSILNTSEHLNPFVIVISPKEIDLKGLIKSKTFQYKITLEDILKYFEEIIKEIKIREDKNKKIEEKKIEKKNRKDDKKEEIFALIRKLNVLFSYYNELGDEFSFINYEKKEELIAIEEDTDINVFINILFLGKTGSGKSALINLILGEKKSLEGGNGFSTTSKNIILYKKTGKPIRLYDVKGIENKETLDNYLKILTDFNERYSKSKDVLNAIFYCKEYKTGTIIEEMESEIFKKLIKFNIKIIFIITKTPYDINKVPHNNKTKETRESQRNIIEKAIKDEIKNAFKQSEINGEDEINNACKQSKINGEEFIKTYVKIYYVNLVKNYSFEPPVPIFGIDKVLSFFSELVPQDQWQDLDNSCSRKEEQKCKEYCKKNPFLIKYSEFEEVNERNKEQAMNYLKGLKTGAFFSGMVPGLDIGMEYFYKYKFTRKLESLYNYKIDEAEKAAKEELEKKIKNENGEKKIQERKNILNEGNMPIDSYDNKSDKYNYEASTPIRGDTCFRCMTELPDSYLELYLENANSSADNDEKTNEFKKKEEMDINNTGKNAASIVRGLGEIGSTVVKALPTAGEAGSVALRTSISFGIKAASWAILPVTCIGFGTWSLVKVNKDCTKLLNIFDKAFIPLRFKTLSGYIKSFRQAISYLESIGKQIIKEENDYEEDISE